jgi:hypothetical protein
MLPLTSRLTFLLLRKCGLGKELMVQVGRPHFSVSSKNKERNATEITVPVVSDMRPGTRTSRTLLAVGHAKMLG